jgi:putative transposase
VEESKTADAANDSVLVSHTGHRLDRNVAYQFTLDPTVAQEEAFFTCAGAARFTFNHHINEVKVNLTCRSHQRRFGMSADVMTPSLSWSGHSRINAFNAWKNGQAYNSPVNDDGTCGLAWRTDVPADVFECASRDAAVALGNFSKSLRGERAGEKVGFPRFKSKGKTTPAFRLRSKSKPGSTAPIRFVDHNHLRLGKLGPVKIHGSSRKIRRMLTSGRFHIHSATVKRHAGRWVVSLTGVSASFHHQHPRKSRNKLHGALGADLGVKALVSVADAHGNEVKVWEGVKALQAAQLKLKRASSTALRAMPAATGSPCENQARVERARQSTSSAWEGSCPHRPAAPLSGP